MIHETAIIAPTAIVEPGASIGPGCRIEDGAFIGAGVSLAENCHVGRYALLEGALTAGPGCIFQAHVHLVNTGARRSAPSSPTGGLPGGPAGGLPGGPAGGSLPGGDSDAKGAILGERCIIRSHAVLYDDLTLSGRVSVGHHSILRQGCLVGEDVSIGNLNQLEGDLTIGARTRFHSNVHISKFSRIGEDCFIAPGFVPTNTPYPLTPLADEYTPGISVADHVKIGANVTSAPGVSIGRNTLIGLGSVILTDIPPDSFAAGNPCKVLKSIFDLYDKRSQTHPYRGSSS